MKVKNSINKKRNKESGITLIALVVTIVGLIILVGVSLNLAVGKNGIITKAMQIKEIQAMGVEQERLELVILEVVSDKLDGNITINEYMSKLKEKGIIEEILEETDIVKEIVTDTGYIVKIEDKGNGNIEITVIGEENKLPPRITNIGTQTTPYQIEIIVTVRRPEKVSYRYWIRRSGESEYRKVGEGKENRCKIENLEQNVAYDIKVQVTNKQGTTEKEKTVTTKRAVTITFKDNGGSGGPGTLELEPGSQYEAATPNRSYTGEVHYIFNKWTTNEDGTGEEWKGIVPDNPTIYYAQYLQENHVIEYRNKQKETHEKYCSVCEYHIIETHTYVNSYCACGQKIPIVTINFHANGGTGGPGTLNLEPGNSYTPSNPTKSYTQEVHYNFSKWTTNQNGTGEEWKGIVPDNATTYFAQYTQTNHSIQFRDNGNGTHQKYCNNCGYSVGENHSIQTRDNGNGTHQRYCNTCSYSVAQNHSIQYRNNGNGTHQKYCNGCSYSVAENHSYTSSNCVCGQAIPSTNILYQNGNQYTSATGGWVQYKPSVIGLGQTAANKNGKMYMEAAGGAVSKPGGGVGVPEIGLRTSNIINITPYRYLKINISSVYSEYIMGGAIINLVIDNDTNANNGQILKQQFKNINGPNPALVDVSSIKGNYYVAIMVKGDTRLYCDKVWLEL